MEPHDFLDDDLRDTAALHVLGALGLEEARVFRLHLGHCDVCRAEVASLARTSHDLLLLAPRETPPPGLFDRILDRIGRSDPRGTADRAPAARAEDPDPARTQVWKSWDASAREAFTFVAAAQDAGFEPTDIAGIEARRLFVDPANDRVTMIVRMRPGTAYPRHRHAAAEECYVLAGELRVGDQILCAGDYQHAEAGSVHAVQSTETGCVLFLVSSLHDELV